MALERASRFERTKAVIGLSALAGIGVFAAAIYNGQISADRTDDGAAIIVDCDNQAEDSELYNKYNNLGSLGMFDAIGFTSINGGNHAGGAATISFTGNGHVIGESGRASVFYAEQLSNNSFGWNTDMSDGDSMLVLGKTVSLSAANDWANNPQYTISGSTLPASKFASSVGSTAEDTATNIYKEDGVGFMNLDELQENAKTLNMNLASQFGEDTNVSYNSGAASHEQYVINVTGSGLAVVNLGIRNSTGWDPGIQVNGLSSGQTLIINVDTQTYDTNATIGSITNNGASDANIILNIGDSTKRDKQFEGNLSFGGGPVYLLAPSATVEINSQVNGTVIADIVNANYNNMGQRYFNGNFPVTVPQETFDSCDVPGTVTLTVEHYHQGENQPFTTTTQTYDAGDPYDAETVNEDYYEYYGVRSGSQPKSGNSIDADMTVQLEYSMTTNEFWLEYRSTEEGHELLGSEKLNPYSLETLTITPPTISGYTYKEASGSLSGQGKDFANPTILYYEPVPADVTLTVEHYRAGETSPFRTTQQQYTAGQGYEAQAVDLDWYEYDQVKADSEYGKTGTISSNITVKLQYRQQNIRFPIDCYSTEEGNPKIGYSIANANALDEFTVIPIQIEGYAFKYASADMTGQGKDFVGGISLYYEPISDPDDPQPDEGGDSDGKTTPDTSDGIVKYITTSSAVAILLGLIIIRKRRA